MPGDIQTKAQLHHEVETFRARVAELEATHQRQRDVETALRESEARYRLLADNASDVIWTMDLAGRYTYVSPSVERIFGDAPEEIIGRRVEEVHPPALAAMIRAHVARLCAMVGAGQAIENERFELELYHKDGHFVWTEAHCGPLCDASGAVVGVVGVTRDIGERKQAEESMRRYALIFAATPDLVSLLDRDYCCQAVNDACLKASNKRSDELIGHHFRDFVGEEAFEHLSKVDLDRCLAGETTHHEAWYVFEGIGRRFLSVTCSPYVDVDNRVSGVVVSGRDITDLKQTEEALRASEERFRLAAQCTSDVIYERDLSTGMAEFYGDIDACLRYAPGGFPRTLEGWITHVHPVDLPRVMQTIQEQFGRGEPYMLEYRLRRSDGTYVDWLDRGLVFRDTSGNLTRSIGAATDVTDFKCAEAARLRLELQLQESRKLEALGALAGGMAHDFNNLLQIIMGGVEFAKDHASPGANVHWFLDTAVESCERARELGQLLVTVADANRASFRVGSLVPLLEAAAREQLEGSAVTCVLDLPSELPAVRHDEEQMRLVVNHLIANALDAMPTGGTLRITGQVKGITEQDILALEPGDYAHLTFHDTGLGIAPEFLPKVFDPYFSTKERGEQKGMGLGLAVCKAIIAGHHGTITAESPPGGGGKFDIYLPVARELTG